MWKIWRNNIVPHEDALRFLPEEGKLYRRVEMKEGVCMESLRL
jgi:hypothetical protein